MFNLETNLPFCWYLQRRRFPHYLKSLDQNRLRHCSLKWKLNLKIETQAGLKLIAERKLELKTERFLHPSSLSSSFGRVFKEDLVPDWRRRLFAHPFLFLLQRGKKKHQWQTIQNREYKHACITCMIIMCTYMRPRALRASLRCNLRFSSVSLRTWPSAAQRSQLNKQRNKNNAFMMEHWTQQFVHTI